MSTKNSKFIAGRLDLTRPYDKSESIKHLCSELENAQKKLREKIAINDQAAIEKLQEIIDNLNKTIDRSI